MLIVYINPTVKKENHRPGALREARESYIVGENGEAAFVCPRSNIIIQRPRPMYKEHQSSLKYIMLSTPDYHLLSLKLASQIQQADPTCRRSMAIKNILRFRLLHNAQPIYQRLSTQNFAVPNICQPVCWNDAWVRIEQNQMARLCHPSASDIIS